MINYFYFESNNEIIDFDRFVPAPDKFFWRIKRRFVLRWLLLLVLR